MYAGVFVTTTSDGRIPMGDVFKQKFKRRDGRRGESSKWYGQYRDHQGKLRRVPLSTDKVAARALLADLVRRSERRRAGLIDDFTEASSEPLDALATLYLRDLELRGRKPRYRAEVGQLLGLILPACGFATIGDLSSGPLDSYLSGMTGTARTRAKHRQAVIGFVNWLGRKGKVQGNPLERSTRPQGQVTRKRRALTIDELKRLVAAAESRPLAEGTLIRWGPRTGEHSRQIGPAEVERLKVQGRHNALLYRTAFYTGLRADELRHLWAGDLRLDGPSPGLRLPGERTKNKRDAVLPLPEKLAGDLRAWIESQGIGPGEPVFRIPRDAAKLLRADLKAAGIEYRDSRGRVADFHSFRSSLSSHLNSSGVPITTAKGLMRHGTISLTADTYHDSCLDDQRGAIDKLPDI